jgi:hypothetical protein
MDGLASFDFVARLPDVQAIARQIYPDARLVSFVADGLRPDGTFDLSGASKVGQAKYTFRSAAQSVEHGGLHTERRSCLVWVNVFGGGATADAIESDCSEPFLDVRCSAKQLLARAYAQGAPKDWLVTIMPSPNGSWGFGGWKHDGFFWQVWMGEQEFYVKNDCDK